MEFILTLDPGRNLQSPEGSSVLSTSIGVFAHVADSGLRSERDGFEI